MDSDKNTSPDEKDNQSNSPQDVPADPEMACGGGHGLVGVFEG